MGLFVLIFSILVLIVNIIIVIVIIVDPAFKTMLPKWYICDLMGYHDVSGGKCTRCDKLLW